MENNLSINAQPEARNKDIKSDIKTEKKKKKKFRKTKIFLIVISFIIALLIIVGYLSSGPAIAVYYSATSGKNNLELAQQNIENQNFSAAKLALEQSQNDFNSAKENLDKLSWMKIIPFVGRQLNAADHLLGAGILLNESLIDISEKVVEIVDPISDGEISYNNLDIEEKREILKNLYQSTPTFQRALSNISLVEVELEKMPKGYIVPQINEAVQIIDEQLPTLKSVIEGAVVATKYLPELAGYIQEKDYLFLFQNNAELRPGGGFIGSYGIIRIKDSELIEMKIDDTYNLDSKSNVKIEMPWQIPTLLSPDLPSWYFRDSAWTPDYPTNAEKAEWFYHKEGGEEDFVGVIAITPTFIEYLMEITGPVKIAGHPGQFTSENVTELIQYHVERRFVEIGLSEEFRKNIIGELANIMMDRLFSLPRDKWDDLFKILGKSINEKHLLMYFNNEEIEKFIEEQSWAGEVKETQKGEDFLMVVDSNMASRKTDTFMDRHWHYNIDLSGETPKVKLDLNYKNTALGFSWKTTRYRTWTRVYAPLGSKLLSVSGNEKDARYYGSLNTDYEVTEELNKTAFGTFLVIEPGESKTITFEYQLPGKSSDYLEDGYYILAQKQIGTLKPMINVNMTLPNDIAYQGFTGDGEINVEGNSVSVKSDLLVDREFLIETK